MRRLVLAHRRAEVAQHAQIVQRVDVAGDGEREGAHPRARQRIVRAAAAASGCVSSSYSMIASDWVITAPVVGFQRRHQPRRVDRRDRRARSCSPPSRIRWTNIGRPGEALQAERDAHPPGGRGTEIGVELHGFSSRPRARRRSLRARPRRLADMVRRAAAPAAHPAGARPRRTDRDAPPPAPRTAPSGSSRRGLCRAWSSACAVVAGRGAQRAVARGGDRGGDRNDASARPRAGRGATGSRSPAAAA